MGTDEMISAEDFRRCMDSILERIKTCEQKIEEIDDDAYKWAKQAGAYKAHLWFLRDDVELFKKIYLKEPVFHMVQSKDLNKLETYLLFRLYI